MIRASWMKDLYRRKYFIFDTVRQFGGYDRDTTCTSGTCRGLALGTSGTFGMVVRKARAVFLNSSSHSVRSTSIANSVVQFV
ncbi:unnamed protein product [Sphacelaria rigidula]